MNEPSAGGPPAPFLPVLLLLFVGSGCAALIYEIVWFQMLELVIGSTAISLGVLLASFMGGMGAGSLAWPRLVSPARHPLRVYGTLELGVAVAAVIILLVLPSAGHAYTLLAEAGHPGIFLRAVLAAGLLLPPTFLMGATLPVVARWIGSSRRGMAWLGFFYGGNTVGAVLGCLLAGYYFLRVHDMVVTTWFAVAINVGVALAAWALAAAAPHRATDSVRSAAPRWRGSDGAGDVLIATALSGFCALAAEVIWTRHLALLLGGTVYTFSNILAVFLAGIGLGGSLGATLSRQSEHPRLLLGGCQFLLAVAVAWAAIASSSFVPHWPIDETLNASPLMKLQLDLARCATVLLPPALLWGASFPLALAALAEPGRDAGRLTGAAYAANTAGAIAGSLLAGLAMIPLLGGRESQQIIAGLSIVAGLVVLIRPAGRAPLRRGLAAAVVLFLAAPFGLRLLASAIPPLPWPLLAFGRQIAITPTLGKRALYFGEGMNSTVGVTETVTGIRSFHVAGKTEASTFPKDMRLQRMLGNIPGVLHREPKSVLIVGCGAGVTAGSFTQYPSIERIVICEIEPLIPEKIAPYFRDQNYDVVNDPRVEIVYDDARHYLLTTKEKFDIITSDPIHPWVKGAATLYTEEYFNEVKERLNPGGLVTQWVPFYESSRAVVLSELATFFKVFPEATVWGNTDEGRGYDVVLLGQVGPLKIDVDAVEKRLASPPYAGVERSLQQVGLGHIYQILATYAGRRRDFSDLLDGAVINRDRDLHLQYLAGLELNSTEGTDFYYPLHDRRTYPADILVTTPPEEEILRAVMSGTTSR